MTSKPDSPRPAVPRAGANDNPRPCPICRKPAAAEKYRPFCSSRCADVDLHRWLGGHYAIPVTEAGDPDEEDSVPDATGMRHDD